MLGIYITTLLLVLGQVVAHLPYSNLDVGKKPIKNPIMKPIKYPIIKPTKKPVVILPFEKTNPSRVKAGMLYQSDMLLSKKQWAALKTRKAIDNQQYRWTEGPNGNPLVPYVFLDDVNQDDVRAGIDHWMEHTCINFEETTNTEEPHLQFHIGNGCSSFVGMIYYLHDGQGNPDPVNGAFGQLVSIGNNCNSLGIVAHEIGHAMGFHHEQSRSERDDYVIVNWENIVPGKEHNFDLEADNNYNVPYDYTSNMHYGPDTFSIDNSPTLVATDPLALELIGSRNGLSHMDKLLANRMYDCIGKWLILCGMSSDPCLNNGYTGKDCECVCPSGTSGSNCENIVDEYYGPLRDPLSEIITTETTITIVTPMDSGTKFTKWIVPPTCQRAIVTFTFANLYDYTDDEDRNCEAQYLNVKTDPSDLVGQIMCYTDVSPGLTLTSDTGIIITMINYANYGFQTTLWTADVTFEAIPGCTVPPPPRADKQFIGCRQCVNQRVITSPNFPEEYTGANLAWTFWTLRQPGWFRSSYSIRINCDVFSLNHYDKLMINGEPYIQGQTITSWKLQIVFRSSEQTSGPGFRCTVNIN